MKWMRSTKRFWREVLNQEFAKKKFPIISKNSILISEMSLTQKNALLVAEDSTVKFIKNKIDSINLYIEIFIL